VRKLSPELFSGILDALCMRSKGTLLMTNEMERSWKEAVMISVWCCHSTFMWKFMKTMKNIGQGSLNSSQDSRQTLPVHKLSITVEILTGLSLFSI
jgi:hypothetical protein